jgi:hypothetical protein
VTVSVSVPQNFGGAPDVPGKSCGIVTVSILIPQNFGGSGGVGEIVRSG